MAPDTSDDASDRRLFSRDEERRGREGEGRRRGCPGEADLGATCGEAAPAAATPAAPPAAATAIAASMLVMPPPFMLAFMPGEYICGDCMGGAMTVKHRGGVGWRDGKGEEEGEQDA